MSLLRQDADREVSAPPSTDHHPPPAEVIVSRRGFLRRFGLGAATAFVVADGIVAYRAFDQGVLAEGEGRAFRAWQAPLTGAGFEPLIAAAVLAASAHNTQPWIFESPGGRVDLFADPTRSTGANDPLQREFHLSLGCAVENLVLAAGPNGYRAEVELAPASGPAGSTIDDATDDATPVASIVLTADPAAAATATTTTTTTTGDGAARVTPGGAISPAALYQAIRHRRSNRSAYTDDPVATADLAALSDLIDGSVAPARLVWLTDAGDRRRFGDLVVEATRAHVADEEQSRDSFRWWRSDWDDIQRHKDGLTIDGVGLRPLVRSLGKILPGTSRTAADATFIDRTVIQTGSAAAFGVILVDDPLDLRQQLAGGRLVQRLHLGATVAGVGFQYLNQITERIDRDLQLDQAGPFGSALAELVGPGALVAFRVGTPTVAALPSPRRPAAEVTR